VKSVLMRHVAKERVLMALPMLIIEQSAKTLVTWIGPGTPVAYPLGVADGRLLPLDEWKVELRTWVGEGRLDLTRPDRRHSIRLF
jgi:hypothetical protein